MTQPIPDSDRLMNAPPAKPEHPDPAVSQRSDPRTRSLSLQDSYLCPVCRHGQITELILTDAFACNFCRHIFAANLQAQTVQVVDSAQPLTWRWNGRGWRSTHQDDPSLSAIIWIASLVLVLLPAGLVWLMAYIFPPLPGSIWAWFPGVWLGCTLGIHLLMVGWLLAEHYQLPIYIASRVRLREWFSRR
ncbi:MAG: hypothetical protein MUF72_11525 [Elainella sp. Prado103]|jgi:hypothetical protein|nr:hypothetical protein [Elainella sp. Prado103]